MFVQWDPENGEPVQEWMFESGDVSRKDAIAIEKQYGGRTYDQFLQGLQMGQIEARAVLLWHMLRQVHPNVRFDDVPDFRVRQLTVHMGVRELKELWERVKKIKLTPDQREAFEAQFESDLREAMVREKMEPEFSIVEGRLAIEGVDLPKPQ